MTVDIARAGFTTVLSELGTWRARKMDAHTAEHRAEALDKLDKLLDRLNEIIPVQR